MKEKPIKGQRWVSDTEPELGLGIIVSADFGRVEVEFPAAGERRQYALATAPLRRVRFAAGDKFKTRAGAQCAVERVEEKGGLLFYLTADAVVPEGELCDAISFSRPEERLLVGQVDELRVFELRADALRLRCRARQSATRGFAGGRVDLLPHQMYIAGEVAGRLVPRVLLADEVGLGKTIEAGLILHRLHLTGRASRVLILVPEPLIHQWFVELLRRFNLLFSLFDEERCAAIQAHQPEANPFLDSQLVLCSVDFLADNPERGAQAVAAGWDLLIVDEAHHLAWSPEQPGEAYQLVENLAGRSGGLLLLTATPQQLGPEGHFARLRLLDPDRYRSLETFLEEANHFEQVAAAIDRVLSGKQLTKTDRAAFAGKSARVQRLCEELHGGDETARPQLVAGLLDEFGTGRVMFRNTRAALSGFPKRKAKLYPLDDDTLDTRTRWLLELLKKLRGEKLLLICKTRALVEKLAARIQHESAISLAVFHEGLTLLQRDRNAAFFSEEEGARILLCSEIGSEGRNFQFAHHLALFDLPENPELLEQRIGRLDRIGQTSTINIHVPYARETAQEVWARWYHDGLGAFEKNLHGAQEILTALGGDVAAVGEDFSEKKLAALLARTRELHATIARKLERGNDRLLELNSCKPEQAKRLIGEVRAQDDDRDFESFFVRLLDHCGVVIEDMSARSYILRPGNMTTASFPTLREEGTSVTFDRTRALSREDLGFMSPDHPLARGAWDVLLGAETGNAAFGVWRNSGQEGLLIEAHAVVECVAPPALHVDRFLPATPIRVAVDHAMKDQSAAPRVPLSKLEKGDLFKLLDNPTVKQKLLPPMVAKAQSLAATQLPQLITEATAKMNTQLTAEIERLEDLSRVNDGVRPEEIAALRAHRTALTAALSTANVRLDAIRLIYRSV